MPNKKIGQKNESRLCFYIQPAGNGALTKKDFLPLRPSWSKKIQMFL